MTTDDSGNVIDPATVAASNAPVAELAPPEEEFVVVPDAEVAAVPAVIVTTDESGNVIDPTAVAESNVPLAEIAPEEIVEAPDAQSETAAPVGSDINSIREELQRRQDEPQ